MLRRIQLFDWRRMAISWLAIVTTLSWAGDTREDRRTIEGLHGNAEILIDAWGVPHIYASTIRDAFFVQGWNAARDRLWQIDLWRRSGLGELSAAFGPAYVEQDQAIRLFTYRGDIDREWAAYGADAKPNTQAFVDGINAYVAAVRRQELPLPEEFRLARYEPAYWHTDDVVRIRTRSVVGSAGGQVRRARLLCKDKSGVAADLIMKISPPWSAVVPEGMDYCAIPVEVLDKYHKALQAFHLSHEFKLSSAKWTAVDQVAEQGVEVSDYAQGSNGWVVSPTRSTTGRPILANDPHRSLDVPSLRYIAHLSAPGFNIIGAGEPALPGVSIGHNDQIAFGLTIFSIAQDDLYVYDTNPKNENQYKFKGTWESMQLRNETIVVRGDANVQVRLKFTRHGPVVLEDREHHKAYAVRAVWLETGGAPYMGAMRYLRARDISEFKAALKHWGAPGENFIYADTNGSVAWFPAGIVPMRPNSDGLLPLPGDGRYEWKGHLDPSLLPSEIDPQRGYIASANQMSLPDGYPYPKRRISFSWPDDFRFKRIAQVLDSIEKVSIQNSAELQNDYISLPAQRLLTLVRALGSQKTELNDFVSWLGRWDGNVKADSAQAALYEIWCSRYLVSALISRVAPNVDPPSLLLGVPNEIINLLEHPDERLGDHPTQVRDKIILSSLADAAHEATRLLGKDRSAWRWGELSTVMFEHPLGQLAKDNSLNTSSSAKSGDGTVVGLAAYDSKTFRTAAGASVRMVLDVGHWDESIAINSPGQSGNPQQPEYRNLLPMWLNGEYFPLLYSRTKVEGATKQRIVLEPARIK